MRDERGEGRKSEVSGQSLRTPGSAGVQKQSSAKIPFLNEFKDSNNAFSSRRQTF
jgi:hypothetical protein